jgi:regulator of RNase E activity RraA
MKSDDPKLLAKLRKIDSATLSNAVEKLGVRNRISGFCNRLMRQLTPEMGVLCGYAVTAEAVTMSPEPGDRATSVGKFLEICSALEKTDGNGIVVIKETSPYPRFSVHCGEVMATLFKKFGGVGLVSDSAVRDLEQVRELGFQLFAPGAVASHGNFRIVRVQIPVTVCGLMIEPGDMMHGDENGLIKVPEEGREKLPDLVEDIAKKEGKILDYLKEEKVEKQTILDLMTH